MDNKGRENVAEGIQQAAVWWEESSLSQKLSDTAENLCAAWNNSALGQFCDKEANSIKNFYEEHKTAINIAIGVGIIAICAVGMIVTGPMGCCLMATAAKGAFYGSLISGAIGASGGAINGAANYMEEHGTLDGSGGAIWEGAAEGFAKGTKTGAEIGYSVNSMRYMKNPNGFCFVAGTLVLTAIGLTCIEDIRPGDYVYAKNEVTGEQDYMSVLETYEI